MFERNVANVKNGLILSRIHFTLIKSAVSFFYINVALNAYYLSSNVKDLSLFCVLRRRNLMSLQNWALNGPFGNLPVHRRMNAKLWHGIKNCQGKS